MTAVVALTPTRKTTMYIARLLVLVPLVAAATACDSGAKERLHTLAHTDSLRTDSLVAIKNDLINEVMASTQFVNDINSQIAKVHNLEVKRPGIQLTRESELSKVKDERDAVLGRITAVVARLDAAEARIASLRARASKLARRDSSLMGQIATYEKTIADLRGTVEQQRTQMQAIIDKQNVQIASLSQRVDTLQRESVALGDTVTHLTTEKNTAYYVIGTKDELVKKGILVEEGHKRFLVFGGRRLEPARELDTTGFTRIDRLRDRTIKLPDGEYEILSRQNPVYAVPDSARDGKITGALNIQQPDRFWASSRFLILVRS